MASFRSVRAEIYDREERKQQYQSFIRGLNAYDRHKKFVQDYASYYGDGKPSAEKLPIKTDQDALREGYRFIRTEEDDLDTSWEQRLVKRYYNKLFKEYCIADMSKYKSGKIGLRWRTEKEVVSGKGQFICGNKHCDEKDDLASYEVNFVYFEAGESKQALVKLVACNRCAEKLHYRRRKEREELERKEKEESDRKREKSETDDEDYDTDSDCGANNDRRRKDRRLSEDGRKEDRREKRERKSHERTRERCETEDEDYDTDSDYAANNDRRRKDRRLSEDDRREDRGEKRERKSHERTRERPHVNDPTDKSPDKRGSRRKGKEKATPADERTTENKDDDETFDEFLEGMFP